jgi:hypothetical protein
MKAALCAHRSRRWLASTATRRWSMRVRSQCQAPSHAVAQQPSSTIVSLLCLRVGAIHPSARVRTPMLFVCLFVRCDHMQQCAVACCRALQYAQLRFIVVSCSEWYESHLRAAAVRIPLTCGGGGDRCVAATAVATAADSMERVRKLSKHSETLSCDLNQA